MAQIGSHMQTLIENGVKILTWSENNKGTSQKAEFDYFAIWTFPDQEMANAFQKLVTEAGWYTYFEQVNVMGLEATAEGLIAKLVEL